MTIHEENILRECWRNMLARCQKANNPSYPRYGGRGISVCERWRNSFVAFAADMGVRPSPKHSIDRINNDGNYEPSNCRWATTKEQASNRSSTIVVGKAKLTDRQQHVFDYIQRHVAECGYPPTIRDIGAELGIRSPNGVMCHLDALAKKGFIRRDTDTARGIQLTSPDADRRRELIAKISALPTSELERLIGAA